MGGGGGMLTYFYLGGLLEVQYLSQIESHSKNIMLKIS